MSTWRLDPPNPAPHGSGDDLESNLREHAGAHVLLMLLALGCRLDVRDGAVWCTDTVNGVPGSKPVPLDILDAIQWSAGWITDTPDGPRLTQRGAWELDRWGRARYTRPSWEKARRKFTAPIAQ